MATPGKHPKTMSSRLATMKFMQRAGASPSSPSTPSEPPAKRQRLSTSSFASVSPATPQSGAQTPHGLSASEERAAADRGETKWYLSVQQPAVPAQDSPLQIVSAGYSTLDAASSVRERPDDENGVERTRPSVQGRRSFGKFNKVVEKQQNPDASSSASGSEASEDDHEDESDDPTGAKAMIAQARKEASGGLRAERKARKRDEKAEAQRMADERRKKAVNLNQLNGISNDTGRSRGSRSDDRTCHRCGEKGHLAAGCPQKGGGGRRQR